MMLEHLQHDRHLEDHHLHQQAYQENTLEHHEDFANRLAQKTIQNHLEHMYRQQLDSVYDINHSLYLGRSK